MILNRGPIHRASGLGANTCSFMERQLCPMPRALTCAWVSSLWACPMALPALLTIGANSLQQSFPSVSLFLSAQAHALGAPCLTDRRNRSVSPRAAWPECSYRITSLEAICGLASGDEQHQANGWQGWVLGAQAPSSWRLKQWPCSIPQ